MILLAAILTLALVYFSLIIFLQKKWTAAPYFNTSSADYTTKFSILVPARNEEKNIPVLLSAIRAQDYPAHLFETIVIDDHSTDGTANEVRKFSEVKLISLQADAINSYKKKAIETGIAVAGGDIILTTDADCIPPPEWLSTIAAYKEKTGARLIVSPVSMTDGKTMLENFQSLDFMILQGITGAVVSNRMLSMCNGANLAYEKKVFEEVGGFAGIDHIASGDDMFLMHKVSKQYPDGIFYLKSAKAIVLTAPMDSLGSFLNQRIRWASKATSYKDKKIFWVLLLVYLFNLSFLILFTAGFFQPQYWFWFIILWITKTIVEWPLFASLAGFFNKRLSFFTILFFQPMHILYTIVSGLFGQFGKYEWKGRSVK